MNSYLHPDMTMVLPDFSGAIVGKETLLTSFFEFCSNARVLEYTEADEHVQVIGDVAFVNFRFDMLYERASYRERSTGRDVWAFKRIGDQWLAVWRMMVDLKKVRDEPK
jgi:ketosteroid isomerase-like protein